MDATNMVDTENDFFRLSVRGHALRLIDLPGRIHFLFFFPFFCEVSEIMFHTSQYTVRYVCDSGGTVSRRSAKQKKLKTEMEGKINKTAAACCVQQCCGGVHVVHYHLHSEKREGKFFRRNAK
jgi:hypothetical protein